MGGIASTQPWSIAGVLAQPTRLAAARVTALSVTAAIRLVQAAITPTVPLPDRVEPATSSGARWRSHGLSRLEFILRQPYRATPAVWVMSERRWGAPRRGEGHYGERPRPRTWPGERRIGGRARPRRSLLQALIYWTLVVGVWALIALIAVFAVFATDLPDTSKIFDVTRQPSISYLDRSGGQIAVRGSQFRRR